MAVTSNIDAVLARLARAQAAVTPAARDGVNAAALVYTTSIRASINSAAPGGFMRGVGRNGAKVGARFLPARSTSVPTALVSSRGPLHLLERNNRPHTILPKRAKALSIGQGLFAASVQHPGSIGKHPFAKGAISAGPTAREACAAAMAASFRKAVG